MEPRAARLVAECHPLAATVAQISRALYVSPADQRRPPQFADLHLAARNWLTPASPATLFPINAGEHSPMDGHRQPLELVIAGGLARHGNECGFVGEAEPKPDISLDCLNLLDRELDWARVGLDFGQSGSFR